jgi:glycosyltransferase involved in cell wall biosynthesis
MSERPLRIAMISYYLPSGSKIGVGYQVHSLATELVRRGHEVDVYSECPPVDGAIYGHRHVSVTGALRTFRFATKLRRVDFSGYDVLHAHGDDYWLWRRRVARHVRTLHGSCFEEALRIRGAWERLRMVMLGFSEVMASVVADTTVVVSPTTRRWTPWVRDVIPNGVDRRRFHPEPTTRSPHPVVLFVGTWGGRKRGRDLVHAFASVVRPAVPAAELWMVTQDAPAAVPDGVRVLGRLSDDELARAYQQSWVFCLPSTYEGFGIPYAEAMASGLPVVATPNVGARYVTDEGRFGVLAELDDIGRALVEVLADETRRCELEQASRLRAGEFSLDHVVDEYESVYRGRTTRDRQSGRASGASRPPWPSSLGGASQDLERRRPDARDGGR